MWLDFKFKGVDIGTDKMFYGLEGKKDLKFTRLKTSFAASKPFPSIVKPYFRFNYFNKCTCIIFFNCIALLCKHSI